MAVEFLVGATGFEPILAESESDVLPLNYAPRRLGLYTPAFPFAIFFSCACPAITPRGAFVPMD